MKVSELIAALKLFDGNLEVYGYCDHGQTPEKVSSPSQVWVEGDDYTHYDGYASDEEDAEELGYKVKAVLL